MFKIKIITIVTIGMLFLSSCSLIGSRTKMLDGMNDNEKMDERLNQVFEVIKNKDKDAFKEMYSKNALEEAENLEENMDYIFELFQGDVLSWNREGPAVHESIDHGKFKKEITLYYYVKTDKQRYTFYFVEWLEDTENTDNVGLYSLKVVRREDEEKEFCYYEDMKPGIHITSQVKEEE